MGAGELHDWLTQPESNPHYDEESPMTSQHPAHRPETLPQRPEKLGNSAHQPGMTPTDGSSTHSRWLQHLSWALKIPRGSGAGNELVLETLAGYASTRGGPHAGADMSI